MAKAISRVFLVLAGLFLIAIAIPAELFASPLKRVSGRSAGVNSNALTLGEYSQLSPDEQGSRLWDQIKNLVEYYRSVYDKDGNQKSEEEWLRHAKAARFIEDLFLPLNPETGQREMNDEKFRTLIRTVRKLSEVDSDQTIERAILFFIREEYKRRPDTSRKSSETGVKPAASHYGAANHDRNGIDFEDKARTKIDSNCFVIGSDPPPGEEPPFFIPRQNVCPFVKMPENREEEK